MSAVLLGGVLFTSIGSLFSILGLVMFFNLDTMQVEGNGPPIMLPLIFTGLGLLCATVGVWMLYNELRKRRKNKALIEGGVFVWATITNLFEDYSMTVNGMPGLCMQAEWCDPATGIIYKFVSEPQYKSIPDYPEGYQVKVYVSPDGDLETYLVSLSEIRRGPKR